MDIATVMFSLANNSLELLRTMAEQLGFWADAPPANSMIAAIVRICFIFVLKINILQIICFLQKKREDIYFYHLFEKNVSNNYDVEVFYWLEFVFEICLPLHREIILYKPYMI